MVRDLLLTAAVAALAFAGTASAGQWDGWTEGRATYYGDDGGTTIHQGSCEYYNIDAHKGTGLDIVALSDASPDYPNSCGTCYAVACRRAVIEDGFGESLDRTSTCHDETRQVIVMVTDTCPCVYPANAMSNKRWCCGDRPHVDLSTQAFQKLGQTSHGVMAARWRRVDCPTEPTYLQWQDGKTGAGGGAGDGGGGDDDGSKKKEGSRRMLGAPAAAPWALGA